MRELPLLFHRQFGTRYATELSAFSSVEIDHFPRNSLLHVHTGDIDHPDIDLSKMYFQGYPPQKIKLDIVQDYSPDFTPMGPLTYRLFNLKDAMRDFRRENLTKVVIQPDCFAIDKNENVLCVINYSYVEKFYRYSPVQIQPYSHWYNKMQTIYRKMNEVADKCTREQFFFYPVPSELVGRTLLDKYKDAQASVQLMHAIMIDGEASLLLLDMWKWLSPDTRKNSLLGLIKPSNYSKINLIFQSKSGKSLLMNLGVLNSWIKGQAGSNMFGSTIQYGVVAMQNLYLHLMMNMNSISLDEPGTAEVLMKEGEVAATSEEEDEDLGLEDAEEPVKPTNATFVSLEDDRAKKTPAENSALATNISSISSAANAQGVTGPAIAEPSISKSLMAKIQADVKELDRLSTVQLTLRGEKLKAADEPAGSELLRPVEPTETAEEIKQKVLADVPVGDVLRSKIEKLAENNSLTAADYKKALGIIDRYEASEDPYGSGKRRKEAMQVPLEKLKFTPEDVSIGVPESVSKLKESKNKKLLLAMHESTLKAYDSKYLKEVYPADMLRVIDSLQRGGNLIVSHNVEKITNVLGSQEVHTLQLKPLFGAASPISFNIPVVQPDGVMKVGGNDYVMRKQRTDVVIRKIAPQTVSMSTYYGKSMVEVSQKVSNNSFAYLVRTINASIFDKESLIKDLVPGDFFDCHRPVPLVYGALASNFQGMTIGPRKLIFDYAKRAEGVDPELVAKIEKNGTVICGRAGRQLIAMKKDNSLVTTDGENETAIGDIYDVLQIDKAKAPIDFVEQRIFSKMIPLGLILGYHIGFNRLVKMLGATYRIVEGRRQKELQPYEYPVTFADVTYIFDRRQKTASLILAGYADYDDIIKKFVVKEMDSKGVYLNLFASRGLSALYIRELDNMFNYFIDPLSMDVLKERGEPTNYIGLLIFAAELMTTYNYPVSQHRDYTRERGYERIPGIIYNEMVKAIRMFGARSGNSRAKISIKPYSVWNAIMQDNAVKTTEDINPIQSLKQQEVVTHSGIGGRNKDTMNAASRAMDPSDVGIASESSVDSADVGTIFYLSSNPQIAGLRGEKDKTKKDYGPANLFSTSVMSAPGSMHDVMKRQMFISTQNGHMVPAACYKQPYVNTGYESVIALRMTNKLFAYAAEKDGKVISMSDKGMVVKYDDGEEVGVTLGRSYGSAEGTTYPHDVVAHVKDGQSFKKGRVLAYNTKFFEPDFIDNETIVMKGSTVAWTMFIESKSTHEDSSTISDAFGAKLTTEVTKVKNFVIDFSENLRDVLKPGTAVRPKDVLMIIEDPITASTGNYSEEHLETLRRLRFPAPRANVMGTIEKIEVLYHGDKAEMSQTLKALADRSDRQKKEEATATGAPVVTGRVPLDYRVDGNPLGFGKAEVRFYINVASTTGVGDKNSFGHQMKCTIAKRHSNAMCTEDGQPIDATFSYRSVAARGVLSAPLLGTTITLLDHISKKAAALYLGETGD